MEKKGGLPDYIDRIAVHLHGKGMPISQAIAVAVNAVKKACATGDLNFPGMQNENAGSRAEACAAVAQWEALKASQTGAAELALTSPCVGCGPLALASWNAMLHPRVPAGQAGGGKFAKGSGGGKKAGGKGGKGAGKKGAKQSASAQAAAQAKVIAPQFLKMNPQQRAAFLAKLTNPQLSALYREINAGNSNDPSTKAALIAIKDQMAARSLTGAKGPTAINQAKAASAAKSAASKQASAAKKAASAQASAAKKQASAQAKTAKQAASNQSATAKAQAAMQATTQKAKVAGMTAALKSTTDPKQQAQILAQLKTALGLAQTAGVRHTLALAADGHQYRHGWVRIDGDTPKGKTTGNPQPSSARPKGAADCLNCDRSSGLITNVDYDENDKPITETSVCDLCDGHGWLMPDAKELAAKAKTESLNERMRREGMPGFTWTGKKWVKNVATAHDSSRQIALAGAYRYRHGWVLIDGEGKSVADKKNKSNADLAAMKASATKLGPNSKAASDYKKAVAETKTAGGGGAPKLPTGVAKRAIIATTPAVGERRRIAAGLSDKDLHATDKAFDKRAIAAGAHGQVDKNQRVVKQEIATRDAAKGLRADHPDVIKAKIKRLQALKKSGQLNSITADRQIQALNTKLAQVQQAAKNKVRMSHSLNLSASPNTGSGDGPAITVNADLKSPRDVKMAVAGHGKVPPHRQAAYRRKVAAAAKKLGPAGMKHVPPAWMKD